ncbi:MAG: DNA gyrase modulator, partial [Pseudomonadota bacterium]|nr:DNA gyrase modulator [Pseudomonadota bacterium]
MNAVSGRAEPDQKELEDIVAMVLDYARQNDVDQAEVAATHDIGLTATVRLGEVESLEYTNDRGVGITVFKDHRKGSASTSDFNPSALREVVNKACSIAELTAADKYAGLADPETMATDPPDLDLAYNWYLESKAAIRIAVECEDAALAYDKLITNSEGSTIGTSGGVRAYANTHGFLAAYPKTSHSLSCIVIGEQNGSMER